MSIKNLKSVLTLAYTTTANQELEECKDDYQKATIVNYELECTDTRPSNGYRTTRSKSAKTTAMKQSLPTKSLI